MSIVTCLDTAASTAPWLRDAFAFAGMCDIGRCAGRSNAPGFSSSLTATAAGSFSTMVSFFLPARWRSSLAMVCLVVLLTSAKGARLAAGLRAPAGIERLFSADIDLPCLRTLPTGNWGRAFSSRARRARRGRCGCGESQLAIVDGVSGGTVFILETAECGQVRGWSQGAPTKADSKFRALHLPLHPFCCVSFN